MKRLIVYALFLIPLLPMFSASMNPGKIHNLKPSKNTPAPIIFFKADTLSIRPLTDKQIREYLTSSYRVSFDQFKKMNALMIKQADALKIANTNNEKLLKLLTEEKNQRRNTETKFDNEQKTQIQRNAVQIQNLNDLAAMLCAVAAVMGFSVIGLWIAIIILRKKIHNLGNKISHA